MGREWKQEPEMGKGFFGLEVREGIWIRVLGDGVMSRGDVGVFA